MIKTHHIAKHLLSFAFFAVLVTSAFASTTTGLPWETPLQTLRDSISGPVAMAISIIAVCITGAMLIWGSELGDFARKMVIVVLVVALLVGANSTISTLFGSTAALLH